MEHKSIIQVIVVVLYVIFIGLFYRIENFEIDCPDDDFETTCVNFCSTDEQALPDSVIRENFHLNATLLNFYENYKIRRGNPNCLMTKVYENELKDFVANDYEVEDFSSEFFYLTPHQYCKNLIEQNGTMKWQTVVCDKHEMFRYIFNGFGKN